MNWTGVIYGFAFLLAAWVLYRVGKEYYQFLVEKRALILEIELRREKKKNQGKKKSSRSSS